MINKTYDISLKSF